MLIDTFGALPDRAVLGSWLRAFAPFAGYQRMFAKPLAQLASESGPTAGSGPAAGDDVPLESMLDLLAPFFLPIEDFAAVLDEIAIGTMGVWVHVDDDGPGALEAVAEAGRKFPGRFFSIPSYDRRVGDVAGRVSRDHRRFNLGGVCVLPIVDDRPADAPEYDGLYETCRDLELPVWIHSVNTWSEKHPSDFSHPRVADRVACRFPDLRIVLGHGGWPWVAEAVAIAWRHPNVYLEPSAFRYKHLAMAGSGWEPLLRFGDSTIADKVLFGSLWPNLGIPLAQTVAEARALPLKPASLMKWTYENAKRFYRL